jgi:uncharacterized RDD family membrane protein YckC
MTDFGSYQRTNSNPFLATSFFATPRLPAVALAGVRTRRMMAFCADFLLVSLLAMLLFSGLFFVTLGLAALILPPLWPFVAFFYNGLSVSGRHGATPGMRMFDLEMRDVSGAPVGFVMAGVHGVLLYVSWLFPPVFLVSLVTPDKRCVHDIFAGVIVVRRPD